MIKFSNACRKDCPWLVLPQDRLGEGDLLDFMEPECSAFAIELGEDEDSSLILKCEECRKITDPAKIKEANLDAMTHSLAVMGNRFTNLTDITKTLGYEMKIVKEAFENFGKAAKKHNLQALIDSDPNDVNDENDAPNEDGGSK